MNIKSIMKSIADTIMYQHAAPKGTQQNKSAIGVIALILAVITAFLSLLDAMQHQYIMMAATLVLTLILVSIFVLSLMVKIKRVVELILCVALSMLCVILALTGRNEGFTILWVLLFPPATMLFMRFIYVASIGAFFEVFIIVLFLTPLKNIVSEYYSQTFMVRFPVLYTAFFALSFLAKYLITKQEIAEYNYIQTIEKLSMIDQLTGIPNRRSFEERLSQEWNRAIRNKEPLSVLFTDVDKFKNYNDSYGHLQGDKALQAIAGIFNKALRRSVDFVARWGGEEFAVLLPNTDGEQAFEVAENIRNMVAETQVPLDDDQATYLTISLGINSQIPSSDSSVDDFIRCADDALYAAKNDGRNKARRHIGAP